MRRSATATPADPCHRPAVTGTRHVELRDRAARPVCRQGEAASGVRAIRATGADPDVNPYGVRPTPPAFRAPPPDTRQVLACLQTATGS